MAEGRVGSENEALAGAQTGEARFGVLNGRNGGVERDGQECQICRCHFR